MRYLSIKTFEIVGAVQFQRGNFEKIVELTEGRAIGHYTERRPNGLSHCKVKLDDGMYLAVQEGMYVVKSKKGFYAYAEEDFKKEFSEYVTKPQLAVTNDVAWAVDNINKLYTEGRIKGFTIQLMLTDEETATLHCGSVSYVEKLGLIEMAKQDLLIGAMGD